MKKYALVIILLAIPLFAINGQLDVRVEIPSRDAIAELVEAGLGIDNYISTTGEVFGVILEHQLDDLLALKYPVEILPITDARVLAAMAKEPSGYPLHSEYVSFMENIATTYPVIAKLDTIGYSVGGRPLLMMKISKQVAWELPKPEFCYISTMHGDETAGMIFLMWFLDSLTQNYGTDPRITRLVDSTAIYINPLMNPDGYVATRRSNNNGVDLNRNFGVPDGTQGQDSSWSAEPETQAIVKFFNRRNISYTMNHHGGALVANYPWDYTATRSPDDSLYIFLARNYADRNIPMFNNPNPDFDHGIVNGADWYIVKGSMQDFSYWLRGDLHLTIELGNTKTPTYSTLPSMWNDNYDAFLAGIEVCLDHGIQGFIADSATGEPLAATVTITPPGRDTYSDSINGYYHRILLAGAVEVTVSAPGYITKTSSVVIPATGLARLDFDLVSLNPITVYRSDFETDSGGLVTRSFGTPQDWEWGEPSLGIVLPHSGNKLWATKLTGQYSDTSRSRLVLEDIELPDADGITLSFFHWYSFQAIASGAFHDGGNMKIWTASGDSAILEPTPDYDTTQSEWNQFIPHQRSFADISYAYQWKEVLCDLTPWRGQTVDISWDFGSSLVNVQAGWYLDDVWIYYPSDTALLAEESPRLPEELSISAYPNPFNSAVRIAIDGVGARHELPLQIDIYDLSGRRVASLIPPGPPLTRGEVEKSPLSKGDLGGLIWQPPTSLPTGIYLVRARVGDDAVSKRIVYLK